MKLGPEKTGTFKGFGFGIQSGASRPGAPAAARPPAARLGGSQANAKGNNAISALFQDSLERDNSGHRAKGLPNWSKPTLEAVKAARDAELLQQADPTIFQYDEVIDTIKEESGLDVSAPQVHSDALTQKKRVGLVVREGSDSVRAGNRREAKYVEKVIIATDRRRVEQQIVEDKLLKKDQDKNKDSETFVTQGFKEELKRRQKFEEELEEQDRKDAMNAADRKDNGLGFADMYRNLLNSGLATSRGGEKIREQMPAREGDGNIVGAAPRSAAAMAALAAKRAKEEEPEDEEKFDFTKEEEDNAIKEEKESKKEELEDEGSSLGVMDATVQEPTTNKRKLEEDEQAARQEKALSAKERFLARKRAAAGEQ